MAAQPDRRRIRRSHPAHRAQARGAKGGHPPGGVGWKSGAAARRPGTGSGNAFSPVDAAERSAQAAFGKDAQDAMPGSPTRFGPAQRRRGGGKPARKARARGSGKPGGVDEQGGLSPGCGAAALLLNGWKGGCFGCGQGPCTAAAGWAAWRLPRARPCRRTRRKRKRRAPQGRRARLRRKGAGGRGPRQGRGSLPHGRPRPGWGAGGVSAVRRGRRDVTC